MIKVKALSKDSNLPAKVVGGTRVYDKNGDEIKGITKLKLISKLGDLWKAKIEIYVSSIEVDCEETKVFVDKHGNKYLKIKSGGCHDEAN
jgi:carbon monoxide dehydrogenase subunit G